MAKSKKRALNRTRRERVESKEGAIIGVAYEMFATNGFSKSTVADIAKAAGVAEGTVYLYFNNKEAIAGAVIASFYKRLTEQAHEGALQKESTKQKLEFLAVHHLRSIIEEKRILQLLSILDRYAETSEIYKMNKQYVAIFDSVVRDGVWRGDIEDGCEAWILRDIFYGSLEYAMRTMEITGRRGEVEHFTKELVMLLTGRNKNSAKRQQDISGAGLAKLANRFESAADRLENSLRVIDPKET